MPSDFLIEEDGAVTVDWVVLTAALVGLGLGVMGVISGGLEDLSGDTNEIMADHVIQTSFPGAPGPSIGGVSALELTEAELATERSYWSGVSDASLQLQLSSYQDEIASGGSESRSEAYYIDQLGLLEAEAATREGVTLDYNLGMNDGGRGLTHATAHGNYVARGG